MNIDQRFTSRRSNVLARQGMVATSQPLAAQAGLSILQAGGSAADADCFALYWDAKSKRVTALNGSGRSPGGAAISDILKLGYRAMPTFTGHAVSIPGTVAGWSDLLERHGKMKLAEVLQPAIRTAAEGYPVSEIIANGWKSQEKTAMDGLRELLTVEQEAKLVGLGILD